jgi:serine protease Do
MKWSVWAAMLAAPGILQAGMTPRQIYEKTVSAVVVVVASEPGAAESSLGTGSILTADGKILTNAHVICDAETHKVYPDIVVCLRPKALTGQMANDLRNHLDAKPVLVDNDLDLAIVQVEAAPDTLTVMHLADPSGVVPGDETVAIGHPESGGLWTITTGVISAQFKDFNGVEGKDVFQMENSLNHGNSGGPLLDDRGYEIGVNSMIARKSAHDGSAITGVNFAIKSSVVKQWLDAHGLQVAYEPSNVGTAETVVNTDDQLGAQAGLDSQDASPTPAPGGNATPVPGETATAVSAQPPNKHFEMDMHQEARPYTDSEVTDFLKELLGRRDALMQEMDQTTGHDGQNSAGESAGTSH